MKNKIGIAVFDLHHPKHIKKLWRNILKLVKIVKPDYFILGGDNMDCESVSHWLKEKNRFRTLENLRLREDYKKFDKEIFTPLMKALPKKCIKVFLKGNHEMWIKDAIEKEPQGEGFWEIENNLDLSDWKVIEYGDYIQIGKAYFIHGNYTNDLHAKKTVISYEHSVFYGHNHSYQVYSKITPIENQSHIGVSVPCACGLNPGYMKNKPNSWLNGFLKFEILPNKCFTHEVITANSNGQFVFKGKNYGG